MENVLADEPSGAVGVGDARVAFRSFEENEPGKGRKERNQSGGGGRGEVTARVGFAGILQEEGRMAAVPLVSW
jgi:hypothetical protein